MNAGAPTAGSPAPEPYLLIGPQDPRRWWVLAACCTVAFAQLAEPHLWMIGFDIPPSAFGGAWREYRFLSSLGVILFVAFQLVGGVLGDLFGRRRVLLVGVAGSVLCNLLSLAAWSLPALIVARALVGVFGALAFPLALGFIRLTFTGDERKVALLIYTFITGAGTLASLLALPIEDWFGWRWALALPIGAGCASFILARRHLPESRAQGGVGRIEAVAAAAWALVTLAAMFGLAVGQTTGTWRNPISVATGMVTVLTLLVIFIWSRHTSRPGLFQRAGNVPRHFLSLMLLVTATLSFALSGYVLQLYQFYFVVEQRSGLVAGLALAPILVCNLFTLRWAGRFSIRQPRHIVVGAGLGMMGGALLLSTLLRPNFPYLLAVPIMALFGLGFLVASTSWAHFFFSVLPADLAGLSAGVNRAAGLVGGAVAGIILGSIVEITGMVNFRLRLADLGLDETDQELALKAVEHMLASHVRVDELANAPGSLVALGLLNAYRESYSVAITSAMLFAAAVCLAVGVVAWLWLRRAALTAGSPQDAPAVPRPALEEPGNTL